jgi:PTH1 family peptidyl-tRNA hydrolase
MGLFQRQPTTEHAQLYTIGMQKSKLIVGLGNIGREYEGTRHNIGFACVDYFAKTNEFPAWVHKKDLKCDFSSHNLAGTRVILIKPGTYMNLSGEAVQAVQAFYKLPNFDTIVVHDELDLPFGQIRTRPGGSDAGNNGIKSIIQHLGEDFNRVRIGVANKISDKADSAEFVLDKFSKDEAKQLDSLYKEVNAVLNEAILAEQFPTDTRNFLI